MGYQAEISSPGGRAQDVHWAMLVHLAMHLFPWSGENYLAHDVGPSAWRRGMANIEYVFHHLTGHKLEKPNISLEEAWGDAGCKGVVRFSKIPSQTWNGRAFFCRSARKGIGAQCPESTDPGLFKKRRQRSREKPPSTSDSEADFKLQLIDTTEFSESSLSDREIVRKRKFSLESTSPAVKRRPAWTSSPKLNPVSVKLTRLILDISAVKAAGESDTRISVSEEIHLDLRKDTHDLPVPEAELQVGPVRGSRWRGWKRPLRALTMTQTSSRMAVGWMLSCPEIGSIVRECLVKHHRMTHLSDHSIYYCA